MRFRTTKPAVILVCVRDIAQTHALTPILAFVPTVQRGQTWLAAAAVALDSVSFYLSALEARGTSSAAVCHRTGVDALRLIAAELADRRGAPEPPGGRHLTRSDFDTVCERLTVLGAALKAERDACWLRFVDLRAEYEAFLSNLAVSLLVPAHGSLLLPLAAADEEALSEVVIKNRVGTAPLEVDLAQLALVRGRGR